MGIYEDILSDFFNELKDDDNFPNEIVKQLEGILKRGTIKAEDIIFMIKGDFNVPEN